MTSYPNDAFDCWLRDQIADMFDPPPRPDLLPVLSSGGGPLSGAGGAAAMLDADERDGEQLGEQEKLSRG